MANCTVGPQIQEKVVQQLKELFGNVLNLDVIKTVAVSCEYDVHKSSNKLLEITSFRKSRTVIEMDNLNNSGKTKASDHTSSLPLTKFKSETLLTPKKSKKATDIERTIKLIKKGYKVLVIMRGLPGSGKSTLAKEILEQTIGYDKGYAKVHILSTDDYFCQNSQGIYKYDVSKIEEAHNWNQRRAFEALSRGFSPIIVDNTNTQMWEMKPYATMACDFGYVIEILEPDTHWCFHDKELAKRNNHGVSKSKIQDMLGRYEKSVTPQKLLLAYNLGYKFQKPPQMRLHPLLGLNTSISMGGLNICHKKSENINANTVFALDHPINETAKLIETIDLMEFNDEENSQSSKTSSSVSNCTNGKATKENLVDQILMINSDSNGTNILQPQQNSMEVIIIDSDDEESSKTNNKKQLDARPKSQKNIFSDIELAWGVNENFLKSWDIVTPIEDSANLISFTNNTGVEQEVVTVDSSCNTNERDFDILKNPTNITEDVTIMITLNRDINRCTPKKELKIPKKSVIDKSCMTDDVYEDIEQHMEELTSLFPSVPVSHLRYWYNKCKGDLEWTIEFLLEADRADVLIDEEMIALEQPQQQDNKEFSRDQSNENVDNHMETNTSKSSKKKSPKNKNDDLKKLIESKIDINPNNYSKHVLRIKHFKFSNNITNDQEPCTSKQAMVEEEEEENSNSSEDNSKMDDVIVVDSDIEFEETECCATSKRNEKQEEETVELNLGDYFVSQLEQRFGDPNISYPEGFQPVVQVPVTLARQLYTFYIESVFQQMENQQQILETLTKEDEEFAQKLQAKEQEAAAFLPISFKEIMAEQEQLTQMQKEAEKWKLENPDNLAARLTRQKLFNSFPTIEQDTLVEILYAHGNKYTDTVESLLASTTSDNVRGSVDVIKEPPIKDDVLEEMKEAHRNNTTEDYNEARQATFYREQANKFLQKRTDLYAKAQQYHQRGMNEVAQFYSTLASQQTLNYERANSWAATAFLDEHAKRLEDFNTLDLHFLYVKEAIPSLDVFLDRNINLLRHSQQQYEHLHIITGRGKNSENGKPKLKPAVISHLQKRNIKFVVLNPGLLKVKITKNSLVTNEFK